MQIVVSGERLNCIPDLQAYNEQNRLKIDGSVVCESQESLLSVDIDSYFYSVIQDKPTDQFLLTESILAFIH